MTTLMLENLKLIVLFLLIGSVIGLSHFSGENPTKMKRKSRRQCVWCEIVVPSKNVIRQDYPRTAESAHACK
jgi:hypothetical protein